MVRAQSRYNLPFHPSGPSGPTSPGNPGVPIGPIQEENNVCAFYSYTNDQKRNR